MSILRLLTLAAVCGAPAFAAAATWDKVGDTGLATVYIDKDSVRRSGRLDAEVRTDLLDVTARWIDRIIARA